MADDSQRKDIRLARAVDRSIDEDLKESSPSLHTQIELRLRFVQGHGLADKEALCCKPGVDDNLYRYVDAEGDKDKPANGLNLCLVQTHISHVGTMGHVTQSTFTQATDSSKPKQMSCFHGLSTNTSLILSFCCSMQNFDDAQPGSRMWPK